MIPLNNDTDIPDDFPQEYLDGWVEFFGLRFKVTQDVLIPRLDTESLVRLALSQHKKTPYDTLIDIGTGSGVIAGSVGYFGHTPFGHIYALEPSREARTVAQENLERLIPIVHILESDLLKTLEQKIYPGMQNAEVLICANLPYIAENDPELAADTCYEPREALLADGPTGFGLYEELLTKSLPRWIDVYTPKRWELILEIGYNQVADVERVCAAMGYTHTIMPDTAGTPRVAYITPITPYV